MELLRLQVRPDWWQRWEFWILGLVGLGVMVRLGWNARSRQLRHQASMLEKTVRERTRELKEVSDVLREQALQDRLTGLANRRQMENQFGRFVARAERNGEPFSLAVIDLNHFKLVNDRYGHTVGDLLLRHVAEHLTGASRPFDLVSRWGGDEFVILLQGADSRAAEDILERIRTMFAEEPLVLDDGSRLFASVSFGVSTWSTGSDELESLFRQADRRVYEDKARTPQS